MNKKIIKLKSNVLFKTSSPTESVLISFDLDDYIVMKGPITSILPMLEKGETVSNVIKHLSSLTSIDDSVTSTDVETLIDFLNGWGFIESEVPSATVTYECKLSSGTLEVLSFEKATHDVYAIESWESDIMCHYLPDT